MADFSKAYTRLHDMCLGVHECKVKKLLIRRKRIEIIREYANAIKMYYNSSDQIEAVDKAVHDYIDTDNSLSMIPPIELSGQEQDDNF